MEEGLVVGKLKQKILEKGAGLVAKSKSKRNYKSTCQNLWLKQVSKKIGKATEQITSKAIDLWNYFKK